MIRRALKGVARRVLGRSERSSSSPKQAAPKPAARPGPTSKPAVDGSPEPEPEPEVELEASQLARWVREQGRDVVFLDIREPHEVMQTHLRDAILIPMNSVPERLDRLPRDRTLVVYCAAGVRSHGVTHYLRQQGFDDSWSLVGGIGAWVEEGGQYEQPDWDSRLRPLMTVRLGPEACEREGLPAGTRGTVQAVRREDGVVRLVVDVQVDGAWQRVVGLAEEDLA